jgi:hypothetical protein
VNRYFIALLNYQDSKARKRIDTNGDAKILYHRIQIKTTYRMDFFEGFGLQIERNENEHNFLRVFANLSHKLINQNVVSFFNQNSLISLLPKPVTFVLCAA